MMPWISSTFTENPPAPLMVPAIMMTATVLKDPYAWKDCPQPQEPVAFGFLMAKPPPINPS